MSKRINIQDIHNRALAGIYADAEIGRIPCYDYIIEFSSAQGIRFLQPSCELIQFLEASESIGSSTELSDLINSIYAKYKVEVPIGLHGLPVWWGPAFIRMLDALNWVEPDYEFSQAAMGWSLVHVQGAFLDIQMPERVQASEDWYRIGETLLGLHRMLEPGPFTHEKRLCEFL